jgi:hypothetical protein
MNVSPAAQDFSKPDYRYRVGISIQCLSYIQEAGSFGFGVIFNLFWGHAVRKYVLGRAVFIDLEGYSDIVIETLTDFPAGIPLATFIF